MKFIGFKLEVSNDGDRVFEKIVREMGEKIEDQKREGYGDGCKIEQKEGNY